MRSRARRPRPPSVALGSPMSGDPPASAGVRSHRTARGAAIRGTAEVAGKLATLAWTVAAARVMSSTEFGVVSYGLATMMFLMAFPSWGFDAGIVRRGAAEPGHVGRLYAGGLRWKTLLALPLVGIAAVIVVWRQDDPASRAAIVLILVAVLPELWSQAIRSASSALQQAGRVSTALVAQRLVTALLVLGALLTRPGVVTVASAFLVGTLTGWIAHRVALRRMGVRPPPGSPTRDDLDRVARGTWLIGLNGVLLMLLMRVDVLFLEAMQGPAAVAVYALAYRLLETVLFVTYAVNQAVFPVLSATRDTALWRRGYERSLSVGAFVYLPFMTVCLVSGTEVIDLLFGDRYRVEGGQVLAWLAPAPLFFAAGFFASILLMAMDAPRPMIVVTGIATAVNIGLNAALIPVWSGAGAAAATTAAYALQAIGMQVVLRRLGVTPRILSSLLPGLVASGALAAALWLLPGPLLLRLLLSGILYLSVWWHVVGRSDPAHREVLTGLLRRR